MSIWVLILIGLLGAIIGAVITFWIILSNLDKVIIWIGMGEQEDNLKHHNLKK